MADYVGHFIDKGDDSELPHEIISRPDGRTCLEYFLVTGKLPWKTSNCDLCKNKEKQEICDKCTGMNNLFIVIDIEEAKERREKEISNGK